MKTFLALILAALSSSPAWAHPGSGIAIDKDGNVYFVDAFRDRSNRIMKVDTTGKVTTFFESKNVAVMHHLAIDSKGTLYTASDDGKVWTVRDGKAEPYYPGKEEWVPLRIGAGGDPFTVDESGAIYAVNERQYKMCQILKIHANGRIVSMAGGASGHKDGKDDEAQFEGMHGSVLAFGPDGALYLTDNGTRVRKIKDGQVSTVARGLKGASGLAIDAKGAVYVAESGRVSMIADGKTALLAEFENPVGVAVAGTAVYVLEHDRGSTVVRLHKIADGKKTLTATVRS